MSALKIIIFFLTYFFFASPVLTADIIINEFSSASNPEWVELYNPTDQTISLKNTTLFFDAKTDTSQKVLFCEVDQISAKSFKLINRPEKSYWLSNDGDTLVLKRDDDSIDTIFFGTGQTLKAPTATQSATRFPDGSSDWIINNQPSSQGEIASFDCPAPATEATVSISPAPSPNIDWSLPDKVYVGKEFKTIKLELSNFDKNTEYFLKIRAGTEEGKLTKIQTKNGTSFLSDSELWSKFPLIKTDDQGKWTGEAKGLLDEDKPDGKYKILLRFRKKDPATYLESDLKQITFLPQPMVVESSKIASNPAVLAASAAAIIAEINLSTPAPVVLPKIPEPSEALDRSFPLAAIFIFAGTILIISAIIALWKLRIWEESSPKKSEAAA